MAQVVGSPIGLLLALTYATGDGGGGTTPQPQENTEWTKTPDQVTTWTKQ